MKKMRRLMMTVVPVTLLLAVMCSCEKAVFDDNVPASPATGGEKVDVVIKVSETEDYVNSDVTRSNVPVAQVCSKLCFAVYQNGERVKYDNQKVTDSGFGQITMSLDQGTYQLLIVGHSGTANPTTTKADQVKFTNQTASGGTGFTDTFYYYGTLTVSSNMSEQKYVLKRATAMFRLITTDSKPASVKRFYFYYTGGSGQLDATTGYGNVNSQQKVYIDLDASTDGKPLTLEVYTFPHQESKIVTFKIEALGDNDQTLYSKELKAQMERNVITQYSGNFFTSTTPDPPTDPSTPDNNSSVLVDTEWGNLLEYTF